MAKTIYLNPDQVPSHLRCHYAGRQFKAIVTDAVHIPAESGLWCDGSRDTYLAVLLSDGSSAPVSDQMSAPWDNTRKARDIVLQPGIAVVRHTIFSGKDLGLTFYIHPENAASVLPAPNDLSVFERYVLEATRSYKSSYGGRDRYELAADDARYSNKFVPTRDEWNATKAVLIERGYLNKAGAITAAGRNAIS